MKTLRPTAIKFVYEYLPHESFLIPLYTARISFLDFYYTLDLDKDGGIPCYGITSPPDNIMWCVYVYNPQYEVKVCLNKKGIIYQTEAAKELNMENILYIRMVI